MNEVGSGEQAGGTGGDSGCATISQRGTTTTHEHYRWTLFCFNHWVSHTYLTLQSPLSPRSHPSTPACGAFGVTVY